MPTAHQEVQFGVQYLAQWHFSIQLGGAGIQTSVSLIARRLAVPPELQPPPVQMESQMNLYVQRNISELSIALWNYPLRSHLTLVSL